MQYNRKNSLAVFRVRNYSSKVQPMFLWRPEVIFFHCWKHSLKHTVKMLKCPSTKKLKFFWILVNLLLIELKRDLLWNKAFIYHYGVFPFLLFICLFLPTLTELREPYSQNRVSVSPATIFHVETKEFASQTTSGAALNASVTLDM